MQEITISLNTAKISKYPSNYREKFAPTTDNNWGILRTLVTVSLLSVSRERTPLDMKNYLCGSSTENGWETPIQHADYRYKIYLSN